MGQVELPTVGFTCVEEKPAPNLSFQTTLPTVFLQTAERFPLHEIGFVTSSTRDLSYHTRTFAAFSQNARNFAYAMSQWGHPSGSIVVVYLTEHEDNMVAIWACLLAGYIPCLQPALSAQKGHQQSHIAHIQRTLSPKIWLTNEIGAGQLQSIDGLDIRLFLELSASSNNIRVPEDWNVFEADPDDDAILFLTSGSTGFSKVVVHTHRTILSACHAKGINYGLTSESHILNWVGLDHVAGSLEMHMTPLLFGASQLHVHASALLSDPISFLRLVDEKSIQLAFAPNFFLAKLARDLDNRTELHGQFDLSSLKHINSGGEAVVTQTARAFCDVFKKFGRDPSKVSFNLCPGFGMTETCAGCIYDRFSADGNFSANEFLSLGRPIEGCEMRVVDSQDGVTRRCDGESGELQVRGPMLFTRYYNNPEATSSSFVSGGWFRTGDIGIIEDGILSLAGRIKDTLIVHGISYGIPELETHLQSVEGVTHSFLAAAPYRAPKQETEGLVIFYAPSFDLNSQHAPSKLFATHRELTDITIRMITLSPQLIVPIPITEMEKSTLGKLSRSRLLALLHQSALTSHIDHATKLLNKDRQASFVDPSTSTEKNLALIYSDIFNLNPNNISANDSFFEFGGTSIDVISLKRKAEEFFQLAEIPIIQILKHPVISDLATLIDSLRNKGRQLQDYDPIVPLQTTGKKTPIFFVHPGIGEVLVFVNLAKYFQNERPFYALRARGFEPGQSVFSSMNEMVTCYATAIKRIQPTGPYAIAGYSSGGIVAFEITRYLEAHGDEVRFTGLINIPPHIAQHMRDVDWTIGMLKLPHYLGLISKDDANQLAPRLRPMKKKKQLRTVWKLSPPERLAELHLTPAKLYHWIDIVASFIELCKQYRPTGSVSAMDVFYAIPPTGSKAEWLSDELKPWSTFSRHEPNYIEVPGQHYTLMDFDHVPQFQKIFRNCLDTRGL
ncbi:atromentin synthetase [Hygrophoropsis aurantiaca]|uniref:Atromentin synthetase n=1 Tax=Hygrophoropsis aurantiaca TaxID=72124 RepID=A0ACB8AHX1_9AGAM|nr:atromentin synthetase [Hygrophoropsis aurantiaca]